MSIPRVAIVGRPNVGKSSLLNMLAGRRISIVDPTAGVTRDRVSTLVEVNGRYFELTDTGGMGIEDSDNLTEDVERQIKHAVDQADVILFVVDIRAGLLPLDEEVNRKLRYVTTPMIVVGNKCDDPKLETLASDFYKLGRGKIILTSAEQRFGREELMDAILHKLPAGGGVGKPQDVALKLAIVGRRNVGKSTFINALAESERMIVSEVAGTTRDSVDVRFERDGLQFVAIDTAGIRRKRSVASNIEFYSTARAERSIRRADIVLLFFDPRTRVSKVDKTLCEYVLEEHKPAIFVINKWDLMKDAMPTERYANYMREVFSMLDYVPIAFVTAKSGKNVYALLNLAQNLHKQASARVGTGDLNRVLREAVEAKQPPMRQNRSPKIYYATQVSANPPVIVLFTNGPQLFDPPYRRYLMKYFREHLPFHEVPIKLYLRSRKTDTGGKGSDDGEPDETVPRMPREETPERESESELWEDV